MIQSSLSHLAINAMPATKPGVFQPGSIWRATPRGNGHEWTVPLVVSLPVIVLVSLGLWAGIFMAVRAAFS